MATSGSSDFTLTRNQMITRALVNVGAIAEGDTPGAGDVSSAAIELEMMVKEWQADGIRLWSRSEAVLHLTVGQASYDLSSSSADHPTLATDAVKTELSADASSGAATIAVDSVTGMANGDKIGVELNDGTLQWTTINGTPVVGAVPLTATLTGAASTDNHVYVYTTKLNRPLRVVSARLNQEDGNDLPVSVVSRETYFMIPNKTTQGKSIQVYYDPQLSAGILYTWPTAESVRDRLKLTVARVLEDFDASSYTPDFPQEWLSALTWNLSDRLTVGYGTPEAQAAKIERMAARILDTVSGFDLEPESVFFQPHIDD